ncbi:MAG: hypothetical protein BJ554DRAFT_2824, partial [Olpidium bornovanus]
RVPRGFQKPEGAFPGGKEKKTKEKQQNKLGGLSRRLKPKFPSRLPRPYRAGKQETDPFHTDELDQINAWQPCWADHAC